MGRTLVVVFGVVAGLGFPALPGFAQDIEIAGINPSERPAGAPVVTEMAKGGAWYGEALYGVDRPYPYSLRFLEDQGNWFNPFLKPGMTGPYDLRGWHSNSVSEH